VTSKHAVLLAAFLLVVSTPGCYLAHVANGQLRLLHAERPVEEVLSDPETPDEVRQSLATIQQARQYARTLGLEVGDQYTDYVDWPGDRVVTIVATSRPGEVTPAGFWFPFLGRLPYKGYFDPARAAAEAETQRGRGLDACIAPVPAYSTLGWLADPITSPMLIRGEGEAIETIFHELVHATVYLKDHADFNETAASFIGQEASVRFYESRSDPDAAHERRREIEDQRALNQKLVHLRAEVAALYADAPSGAAREATRAALETATRAEIAALPMRSGDAAAVAQALRLNDACLALIATYGADLHQFESALAAMDGDLVAFIARLRAAEDAPDPADFLLAPASAGESHEARSP